VAAVNMGTPIGDEEWEALKERFPWLRGTGPYTEEQLREAIDAAFDPSDKDRAAAARRELRRLTISHNDDPADGPLFHYEWLRSVEANPELADQEQEAQDTLRTAYYDHDIDPEDRESARQNWRQMTGNSDRSSAYYGDT
jgi:phenylpropionate dioxygenase-like ring-hydroxylating dioxygenase large terminal subunit